MAVAHVASSVSTGSSVSVTVSSPSNGYLLVRTRSDTQPSSVARDGQSLTLISEYVSDGSHCVWGVAAPNNGTANVTVSGGGTVAAVSGSVFSGVDQASPVVAFAGRQWNGASPWSPSAITTEADGYIVHAGFVATGPSYAAVTGASGSTTLASVNGIGNYVDWVVGKATAGASDNTSATIEYEGGVGESNLVSLKAASGGGSETFTMTQQPTDVASGAAISPSVVVTSSDSGSTATVTASKASGTGTLGGTTTAAMTAGVATFANLVPTGSGSWTLAFDATGHTQQTSSSFTVSGGGGGPTAATKRRFRATQLLEQGVN